MTILPQNRYAWTGLILRLAGIFALLTFIISFMAAMPGKSFQGSLPPLSTEESMLSTNLRKHVVALAQTIGERNTDRYSALQSASKYIDSSFAADGYSVNHMEYRSDSKTVQNLEIEIRGGAHANEIVVIGAHYDSVFGSPGADDNASGVAAILELTRVLKNSHPSRTIRLVAFVNEEPPNFQTESMGSWVYAKQLRARNEKVVAAISVESIGMYSDAPGSQHYPKGFSLLYPTVGNFVGFVGNTSSRELVRDAVGAFRKTTNFPSEGVAAPGWMTGIGWSDHWSFWQEGYPAIMVTDTAIFRNPTYHHLTDTPDTIDYDRTARVVLGLSKVVTSLAN